MSARDRLARLARLVVLVVLAGPSLSLAACVIDVVLASDGSVASDGGPSDAGDLDGSPFDEDAAGFDDDADPVPDAFADSDATPGAADAAPGAPGAHLL